jgi:ferredoxin
MSAAWPTPPFRSTSSSVRAVRTLREHMTYVIAGTCIKDDSCIEVCPVDCIHPKPGAPEFETAEQLYIDPELCIDCDACVEACPVDAIFADFELPEKFAYALELNAEFFGEQSTAERTAA